MTDKLTPPPQAQGPEKSILSSMLKEPEIYIQRAKSEGLTDEMFYNPANALFFRLLVEKQDAGEDIELISLTESLANRGILENLGGPAAVAEIYTYAPSSAHFTSHLKIVRDRYAQRMAIEASYQAIQEAQESEGPENALRALKEGVDRVSLAFAQKRAFQSAREAYKRFIDVMKERLEAGSTPGITTGIHQLDEIGGGMRAGEFWVICGETSAGKSALSYQVALPSIEQGLNVLIFTLEMGSEEVLARLVSAKGRIDLGSLMTPKGMTQGERLAIEKAGKAIIESNLKICDEPNISIDYVCSQCEQFAELNPVDLVIVDYIQLLEGDKRKGETREQELARTSRSLKQLAKKLKCPVISPAQLNDDGKLRESRAIGQDADVVLKIIDTGVAVNKYRNAQRNEVLPLGLVGKFQRFETIFTK